MATCRRRGALLVNMCGFEFCRQTWFTTRKLRTCKWMPASTASWRAARMMDSRAAIGPAHPATHAAKDETFGVRALTR